MGHLHSKGEGVHVINGWQWHRIVRHYLNELYPRGTIQITEIIREDVMREVHLEKMMKGQAQPLSDVKWGEKGNPTISHYPCAKGEC